VSAFLFAPVLFAFLVSVLIFRLRVRFACGNKND
jgi:hypothetical protein